MTKRDMTKECGARSNWGGFGLKCILPKDHQDAHRANGIKWAQEVKAK